MRRDGFNMTIQTATMNAEPFSKDPLAFLSKAIKEYTAKSPLNRLRAFSNEPIFDEPLVAFADGDDPLFQDYKGIIGDFHLTPREALKLHLHGKGPISGEDPPTVSVIAWALPITKKTRVSMRKEFLIPSLRWNHTRWQGQEFMVGLSRHVSTLFEELGYRAVAPNFEDFFGVTDLSDGQASNWSQRHIAYVTGLGTFSLNDGFISPKGIAVRIGSIVADVALHLSPTSNDNHVANCLFYKNGSCGRCIERCPANAISEKGHDKIRCQEFVMKEQTEILRQLRSQEGYIGRYLACGSCQTGVPCEDKIPKDISARNRQ
jgi:ferredoxin